MYIWRDEETPAFC